MKTNKLGHRKQDDEYFKKLEELGVWNTQQTKQTYPKESEDIPNTGQRTRDGLVRVKTVEPEGKYVGHTLADDTSGLKFNIEENEKKGSKATK